MAYEVVVGLVILGVAIVIAWILARRTQKGTHFKEMPCPHCGQKMPRDARSCPHCSKEIRVCGTCKAYILDSDGTCEVCGESARKRPQEASLCPRCGARVDRMARSCPSCGERFWSPIVDKKRV